MVEILKSKYRGCCFNCLIAHKESDIYRIEIRGNSAIELCKDCLGKFLEELNNEYLKILKGKE